MPKTKVQGVIFGLIMSYAMAIGMEIYNSSINMGVNLTEGVGFSAMTYGVLAAAMKEASFMGIIVFVISNLWGNRIGAGIAAKHVDPERDNPYFCMLMRQAGTVMIMCPSMSLVATILFNVILAGNPVTNLPVIWIGTVIKNFPMAFFWNMFAAAPFTRLAFGFLDKHVFSRGVRLQGETA